MQLILRNLMMYLKNYAIWSMCVSALLPLTVGLLILHSIEYTNRICQSLTRRAIQYIERTVKSLSLIATNHRNSKT